VADYENRLDKERFEIEKRIFLRKHYGHFPPVGVMMTAYNRSDWLCEAIDSVLNQTYPNMRVFIGDDSTNLDVEKAVRAKYMDVCDNVFYERNIVNLGQSENMLRVYERTDTELRTGLNDDDMLPPDSIEMQMNYFVLDEHKEISVATGQNQICDSNMKPQSIFANIDQVFTNDMVEDGWRFANFMMKNNLTFFVCFGGIFRASCMTEPFGTMNGRSAVCNKDRFPAYVALSNGKGLYVNRPVFFGRQHEGQQEWRPEFVLGGGNDYCHEVLSARKYGFLRSDEEYEAALKCVASYYDNFGLKSNVLGALKEEYRYHVDECLTALSALYKELSLLGSGH
jgi:glycosyltransferase involved in cell wall biosynthesis